MFDIQRSNKFKRSLKRVMYSQSFDKDSFESVLNFLTKRSELPQKYRDHQLKGEYHGLRECHIKSDCLLIYKINIDLKVILLVDIGNHANLFE